MNDKNAYIAVVDSGVGGISVLRHLLREMPGERFLYFGDSANAPYGVRPQEEIRALTHAMVERLMPRGLKAVVVACNTATAAALESLEARYPDTVIVGTEPALKLAAETCPGGQIGVMATPGTLESRRFQHILAQCGQSDNVHLLPAAGLADLVEVDKQNGPEGRALLTALLGPYIGRLDALVLGCTHYPFAEPMLRQILGERPLFLDGGLLTARRTRARLAEAGLLRQGPGELLIENSLPGDKMNSLARKLLNT